MQPMLNNLPPTYAPYPTDAQPTDSNEPAESPPRAASVLAGQTEQVLNPALQSRRLSEAGSDARVAAQASFGEAVEELRELRRHNSLWEIVWKMESLSITPSQPVAALIFDEFAAGVDRSDLGALDNWQRAEDVLRGRNHWEGLKGDLAISKGEVLFDLYEKREPPKSLILSRGIALLQDGIIEPTAERYALLCERLLHCNPDDGLAQFFIFDQIKSGTLGEHAPAVALRYLAPTMRSDKWYDVVVELKRLQPGLGDSGVDVAKAIFDQVLDPTRMDPEDSRRYTERMEVGHELLGRNLLGPHTRHALFTWLKEFESRGEALPPAMLAPLTPQWLAQHAITLPELKQSFPGLRL